MEGSHAQTRVQKAPKYIVILINCPMGKPCIKMRDTYIDNSTAGQCNEFSVKLRMPEA